MNLFVVGPRALSDWILRMTEDTKDQLLEHSPRIRLRVTSDVRRADAVVYETDQRETIDASETYHGVARLCIVEPGSKTPRSPHETRLFRASLESEPEWLKASFEEAIRTVFLQCHLLAFQRTLSGPFSHDIRGALSVVSLSRQFLESGGGGKLVAGKLSRVDARIRMALFDIEARSLCLSGAWPPSAKNTQMGTLGVEEVSDWFARTNGERTLETSEGALEEIRAAPAWVTLAVAGCIDGVTRLTQGKVAITTDDKGGCSCLVRVSGENAELDESQLSSLAEPERWPLLSAHVMPYRLGTAALLVCGAGGSVISRVEAGRLIIEIRLP